MAFQDWATWEGAPVMTHAITSKRHGVLRFVIASKLMSSTFVASHKLGWSFPDRIGLIASTDAAE